jgi:hypothetical protein
VSGSGTGDNHEARRTCGNFSCHCELRYCNRAGGRLNKGPFAERRPLRAWPGSLLFQAKARSLELSHSRPFSAFRYGKPGPRRA